MLATISVCNTLNHLTMCKQMSSKLFRNNVSFKLFTYKSYIPIYKQDLVLNKHQRLIYH